MQSRLLLLMHEIGVVPAFNCKSGKDRTGMCNAEIDILSTQIRLNGGIVPLPYATPTIEDQTLMATVFDQSGAHAVTRDCTGHRGLKIQNPGNSFNYAAGRMGYANGASGLAHD
jgi:phosphatidylinositol-4,5-bisphosphate 4-phosphatase